MIAKRIFIRYNLSLLRKLLYVLILLGFSYLGFIIFVVNSRPTPQLCQKSVHNDFDLHRDALEQDIARILVQRYGNSLPSVLSPEPPTKEGWVEIVTGIHVFSAFLEAPGKVHALGAIPRMTKKVEEWLECAILLDSQKVVKSMSKVQYIPEHHYKTYTAVIFTCQFFIESNTTNYNKLQLTLYDNRNTANNKRKFIYVNVFSAGRAVAQTNSIAMCIRPLFGPFNSTLSLAEFVAYYSMMKADKFYFYVMNVTEHVWAFLNLLKREVPVEVLHWDIPLDEEQIHCLGQMVHIQDCLFRASQHFSHVIFVDLDEFIFPRAHNDLKSLIAHLETTYGPDAGAFIIPSIMYCKEYVSSVDLKEGSLPLVLQVWCMRQQTPWPIPNRSKIIARSGTVWIGGIHDIWEYRKESEYSIYVSHSVVLVNHYRTCCGIIQTYFLSLLKFSVLRDAVVRDDSMKAYVNHVLNSPVIKVIYSLLES